MNEKHGDGYGYSGGRYFKTEETASLWLERMGSIARRSRFPSEVHGVRTPDHDSTQAGGEKCQKCL